MIASLHSMASRIRRSPTMRPLASVFRRIEPAWNWCLGRTVFRRGFETHVNGDVFRLTYAYGARYDKAQIYEPDIYLPYASSIRAGMTVIDVGAHVGFFTLAAAQRVGAAGTVVAFEPSPKTHAVLRRHIALNGWADRATAVAAVASDRPGHLTFYTYGDSMAASVSRVNVEELNAQRPEHAVAVEVPALTLDEYCASRDLRPDVIKIDVEGAELRVLRGAEGVLRGRTDLIVWCEVHPAQMKNVGDDVADLIGFVQQCGYAIEPIAPPGHMGIYPARIARRGQ